MMQKEYQRKGIMMKKDKLVRNVLDKAAAEFIELRKDKLEKGRLVATNAREQHFAQHYKKK